MMRRGDQSIKTQGVNKNNWYSALHQSRIRKLLQVSMAF
ncbi:alginate lyase precursor [Vibrio ishigakensis]|uniref:Alginate lyase n=1 Tax=Vibrio ishigakensis TaxID=1481914 RepID=A0A0B8P0Y7_9VIBR|nr:alginate lyase precursor [Vibrio ishigakensis]